MTWSPVYWDWTENRQKITLVDPIWDRDRNLVGVLGVDLVLSQVSTFLKGLKVEKNGKVLILDETAQLISTSIIDLSETPHPPDQPCRASAQSCRLLQEIRTIALAPSSEISRQLTIDQQAYLVRIQPFKDDFGLQWKIVVLVPETDVLSAIVAQNRMTAWLCFGALLLAIGSGLITAKWLSEPIRRLCLASNAMMQNALPEPLQPKGADEVRQLIQSFNQMVEEIDRSRRQLQSYAQSLEDKVRDRTQALEEQNTVLEQAMDTLTERQEQLIQAEKLAVLGQLIASVAHDLNTPLGVISASSSQLGEVLGHDLLQIPQLLQTLPVEEQENFFALLRQVSAPSTIANLAELSHRDRRKLRRQLSQELQQWNLPRPDYMADTLVDCGICDLTAWKPLLCSADGEILINLAYQVSSMQRTVRSVRQASDRASKVVLALKRYAHKDWQSRRTVTQVVDGIEATLILYAGAFKLGIDVVRHYEAVDPIACYPDELDQVWANLIQNAIHAMDASGTLTIAIHQRPDWLDISMSDTGHGIPAEILDQVFTPFFTTKPPGEGNGLGLSIVKKIIDQHDGKIEIETSPQGTTFKIHLPRSK